MGLIIVTNSELWIWLLYHTLDMRVKAGKVLFYSYGGSQQLNKLHNGIMSFVWYGLSVPIEITKSGEGGGGGGGVGVVYLYINCRDIHIKLNFLHIEEDLFLLSTFDNLNACFQTHLWMEFFLLKQFSEYGNIKTLFSSHFAFVWNKQNSIKYAVYL